jgi:uncharacterized protein (DUF3084 family)
LSALTKVFVVLLVILSMLLSAATVVFVNSDNAQRTTLSATNARLNQELKRATEARSEMEAARQIALDNLSNAMQQNEQLKQQMNNQQVQLIDRATQLGQAQSQLAMLSADITRLSEGLHASERTKASLQEQVTELRRVNDQRLTENTQLNQAVSDLTNRLDVTERERRNLAEQLAETRSRADQLGAQIRGLGLSAEQTAAAGSRVGPQVTGVVRQVRPIQGIPYATISVGSNDGVRRGMEMRVVNRDTGDFLGMLTVESVEINEATGRLQGPRVADIRAGSEVRTQTGA